ncbi:MAG: hypothetical protein U0869_09395 [Chloroflexota bacterium]
MDPDDARPDVLIVGGLLTPPLGYRPLRRRLEARGARSVTIAPVHAVDWLAAAFVGLGPLMTRTGLAIRRAHRLAGRRPLLVVGHSGGGVLARLALSPEPYAGRRIAASDAVGCLVTLGTPHGLGGQPLRWRHAGAEAAAFLEQAAPPAAIPGTAFVTVGSDGVPAGAWETMPAALRLANLPYRLIVGPVGPEGGDGIVGTTLTRLDGATHLTLHEARHGTLGSPWYGDDRIVDQWWPVALAAWRESVARRTSG